MADLPNKKNLETADTIERDYLTGLSSRRGLYDYYDSLDSENIVHAMYIDIDNFKRVNDVYGHSMGDKLLIEIGQLIQSHIGDGFASRIGGDEYVALLSGDIPQPEVEEIAKKLLINMQNIGFRKDILSLISLSIGIVIGQGVSQTLDDVLAKCDSAMYQAKNDGKNRYTVFKADDKSLEINRSIELEMEDALLNGEFIVYLQPKVNMISSELYGAEALARWNHPVDGVRLPASFIPLFEKNGFISKLDMYIFEEVCRIKASWEGQKYEHIPVSVNMSRLHLYNKHFPEDLENITKKYGIDPSELELEITESTFLKDSKELIEMIKLLKDRGFLVSIDDFGSGFSAINLLKDLQVDTIKVDRGFLKNGASNHQGRKIIRHVIAMCLDLKMEVIAEGIETKEQIDLITRCGCSIAQGFYYSKPLPLEKFIPFADEYMNNALTAFTFHLDNSLLSEDGGMEGTICGEGLTYTDGIFKDKKAMHFPGGKMETNTISIPTKCMINDSFTVSLWIRPMKTHQWTSALYIKFETGFLTIVPTAWEGHSSSRIRDSKEINGWYDVSGCQLAENTWWHYVVTYNSKTETATAFINGEVVNVLENVPTNRYVKRILLGGDVFQPSFVGDLCELMIYNSCKDYDFISDLHQSYVTDPNFIAFPVVPEEP